MGMRTRKAGLDTNGEVKRLGETDSLGYQVGWIDEDGCCWESVRERDIAIATGRWLDARKEWQAGVRSRFPSRLLFAVKESHQKRNIPAIMREMRFEERFWERMTLAWRRERLMDDPFYRSLIEDIERRRRGN